MQDQVIKLYRLSELMGLDPIQAMALPAFFTACSEKAGICLDALMDRALNDFEMREVIAGYIDTIPGETLTQMMDGGCDEVE